MKRKITTLLLSTLLLLLFAAPALAQGPGGGGRVIFGENFTLDVGETMNGDLVVLGGTVTTEISSTVRGSLVAFGGNVAINGTVDGEVAAIGGDVTIDGNIDGDVAALGGNVILADTAIVDGDIGTFGGRLDIAEGAVVTGQFKGQEDFFDDDDFDRLVPPSPPRPDFPHDAGSDSSFSSIFGWVGRLISDVVWTISLLVVLGLITWLVAAFMPEQMLTVQRTVAGSTAVSFGLGLMTAVVAGVVGTILLITICLAFIPIIAYIVLAIATLFGWIVIGQMLGERLLVASGRPDPGFIFSSIVGVLVLTLLTNMPVIGQIPCLGWLLGLVGIVLGSIVSLTGMGAVLLTRFGTRPYPATGRPYAGGPAPRPTGYSGSRVRWTDPQPEVSDADPISSEAELNARIKAALAESGDMGTGLEPESPPEKPAPDDAPAPDDDTPGPDDDQPESPDEPEEKPKD